MQKIMTYIGREPKNGRRHTLKIEQLSELTKRGKEIMYKYKALRTWVWLSRKQPRGVWMVGLNSHGPPFMDKSF
jgi:hypothetical protein